MEKYGGWLVEKGTVKLLLCISLRAVLGKHSVSTPTRVLHRAVVCNSLSDNILTKDSCFPTPAGFKAGSHMHAHPLHECAALSSKLSELNNCSEAANTNRRVTASHFAN